ncbi:MAG TPA: hypothetical protein VGQ09_13605 [Chitinophagaceae bacterium]|jgi:hypothetical protein|nr:hypothetical protein [Chitinophagaceae bacterium]
MKTSIFIFLLAILLASCKSTYKISKSKAAGLDTITDINQLETKKRAIYKNSKGELFIMRYEPDPDSLEDTDTMQFRSGGGAHSAAFTIIVVDGRCDSENFEGSNRKQAKISISPASLENFNTLRVFMKTLQDANDMAAVIPGNNSLRIPAENRNVKIKKTYLYCYSRQTDEDFHVIIGTTKKPSATTKYFNVEVSGLPLAGDASFPILKTVRTSFYSRASQDLCKSGYYFFEQPLKIEIKGSLFFDKQHHNGVIGPEKARPANAWEIHPITSLKFK